MSGKPRYFVAIFGDPEPGKDPVGSGIYSPDPKYAPFPIKPGDVMLPYCTANYAAYSKQVPGVGVALRVTSESVEYLWIPFVKPMPKEVIDQNVEPADAKKLREIRFAARWLFEVSKQSFSKTAGDRFTAWGKV